jgi:hypothetical protein
MNEDLEHLNLLSKGYYIYGILSALFYLIPLIFIIVGIFIITGKILQKDAEIVQMGPQFLIIGVIMFFYGQITSIATIFAGKYIKNNKNHLFCLIIAGFNCMFFPIGTALGVFTFVVLLRESVKKLFTNPNL